MYSGSRATNSYGTVTRKPDHTERLIEFVPVVVSEKPAVFLIGGHDLAFEGLKTLLLKHHFDVVGTSERLSETDISVIQGARRFLVIVDGADGTLLSSDDIALFRQDFPQACIVALVDGAQETASRLRNSIGANNAILDRNMPCDALIKALNVVMSGYGVLSPIMRWETDSRVPNQGSELLKAAPPSAAQACMPSNLSDRELQIIGCIAEGQSNKVIARRFSISEATVKIHVRGILRKVDARNRTQAAIWAIRHGFGSSAIPLD